MIEHNSSTNSNGASLSFSTFRAASVDTHSDGDGYRQRRAVSFTDPPATLSTDLCSDDLDSSSSDTLRPKLPVTSSYSSTVFTATATAATATAATAGSCAGVAENFPRYAGFCGTTATPLGATATGSRLLCKSGSLSGATAAAAAAKSSYRLVSMDRLAQRHKLYSSLDSSPPLPVSLSLSTVSSSTTSITASTTPSTTTSTSSGRSDNTSQPQHLTASMSTAAMLNNKREMFFRNDAPAAPVVSPPAASQAAAAAAGGGATPAVAKEALTASHSNGRGNKENLPDPSVGVGRSGSTVGAGAGGGAAAGSKMTSHQPPSSLPTPSALSSKSSSASTPAPSAPASSATVQSHRAAAPPVSSAAAAAAAAARPAVAGAAPGAVRAAASAMAKAGSQRQRQLDGYVGFANLPNQVYRRAVKRGFHFTLMVVGEAGLGKSTLVNSLFMSELYSSDYPGPSQRVKKTVQVEKTVVQLKENGVNLTLTVVDTPGFGDAVDNSNCWQPVIDYIEQQYATYLNAESLLHRSQSVEDTRVHCCLYFIAPSGHTLKPLDVEFMRRLHDKVNIVPVIAKADTMTPEEVAHFKRQVVNEINQHKIKIYEFPDCDDDEENRSQRQLRDRVPFAVVGANTIVEVDGKKVRGRRYPWGTVQVDNMEHSDFIPLRKMLICTHMTDLCAVTSNVHYENYRCRSLAALSGDGKTNKILNKNPLTQMEEERQEQELRLEKFKSEMQLVFDQKVKEKKAMLEQSEANFRDKKREMDEWLKREWNELETRRYDLLRKRKAFQEEHGISWEEMRRKDKEHGDHKKKRKGIF